LQRRAKKSLSSFKILLGFQAAASSPGRRRVSGTFQNSSFPPELFIGDEHILLAFRKLRKKERT
jgi:hypothetical protein